MLFYTFLSLRVVQVYETILRYPFPKSLPSGKGLTITSFKVMYFKYLYRFLHSLCSVEMTEHYSIDCFIFFQFRIGRTNEIIAAATQNHDTGPKSYILSVTFPAASITSTELYCIIYPLVIS